MQDFTGAYATYTTRVKTESALRKLAGEALWLTQTRYDIGFLTIRLSTLLVSACANVSDLHVFLKTAEKLHRIPDERPVAIWYHAFILSGREDHMLFGCGIRNSTWLSFSGILLPRMRLPY